MRWPWQRASDNRGTLTLLPDGKMILGLPHGMVVSQELLAALRRRIDEDSDARTMVFGFPVDVVDKPPTPDDTQSR